MSGLRIGSLFSGAGMLDEGVRSVLGGTVAWHSEVDPAAARVLDHRYPGVLNLGDVTAIDWAAVEPVDVITGGSPCQDVSAAGKRAGMRAGTRSGLWASMVDAIDVLRPGLVVWENVRGVLSAEADSALEPCAGCVGDGDDGPVLRAFGRVLGDLAELGYDASWHGLRAADVGAPHGRFRVFVVAADSRGGQQSRAAAVGDGLRVVAERGVRAPADSERGRRDGRTHEPQRSEVGRVAAARSGADVAADAYGNALRLEPVGESRRCDPPVVGGPVYDNPILSCCGHRFTDHDYDGCHGRLWSGAGCCCPRYFAADAKSGSRPDVEGGGDATGQHERAFAGAGSGDCARGASEGVRELGRVAPVVAWGVYEPAIRRWERLTRPAPSPTEIGPKGGRRLSPRFTEWMQGWPDGWVTDVPGVSRNDALKICGNGVVPQQAAEAVRRLLAVRVEAVA